MQDGKGLALCICFIPAYYFKAPVTVEAESLFVLFVDIHFAETLFSYILLSDDGCYYFSSTAMIAEFTEVYTLPDTHIQSTISDRYAETITCQSRFSMGGHVVISFTGMHIVGFPFFHQVVEDGLHVRLDIRICIFIYAKSGRGMLDEQM